jgi:hypothetical protein
MGIPSTSDNFTILSQTPARDLHSCRMHAKSTPWLHEKHPTQLRLLKLRLLEKHEMGNKKIVSSILIDPATTAVECERPSPAKIQRPSSHQGKANMRIRLPIAWVIGLSAAAAAPAGAQAVKHRSGAEPLIQSTPNGPSNPCLNPKAVAADPYIVCVAGAYAGSDPDPRIRASLARDFQFLNNNR